MRKASSSPLLSLLLPGLPVFPPLPSSLLPACFPFSHFLLPSLPVFTKGLTLNLKKLHKDECQPCSQGDKGLSRASLTLCCLTSLSLPVPSVITWTVEKLKQMLSCEDSGRYPQLIISRHIRDVTPGQVPWESLCARYMRRRRENWALLSQSPSCRRHATRLQLRMSPDKACGVLPSRLTKTRP